MNARTPFGSLDDREPTAAELDAIADEWPLVAAELAVLDAEITIAAGDDGVLALRRLALARRELAAVRSGYEPIDPDSFRLIPSARPMRRSA